MSNSATSPDEKSNATPSWIWRSRPGTTQQGALSLLAAFEVVVAVVAYWSIAFWMHTQVHLLVSVVTVPLLLLRSEQSIALGLRLYEHFDFSKESWNSWYDRLSKRILETSLPRWIAIPIIIPIGLVGGLSAILIAFPIRAIATTVYLIPGFKSLSQNWWRTLFATDLFTRPEIVPGHADGTSIFSFESLLDDITGKRFRYEFQESSSALRFVATLLALPLSMGALLIFVGVLGPSYLYMMSIKSTAWAHWPLAYISRPLSYADDPEEVRMRLWVDPREWLRRLFMVVTFAGALVASVPSLATIKSTFPEGAISIVEYAVLIDLRSLISHPWRIVALASAAITFVLTWYGLELSLLVRRAASKPDRLARAGRWAAFFEYLMRIRDVCGWIFWGLLVVHAAIWLAPSTEWLRGYPQEVLRFIYGDFLPRSLN